MTQDGLFAVLVISLAICSSSLHQLPQMGRPSEVLHTAAEIGTERLHEFGPVDDDNLNGFASSIKVEELFPVLQRIFHVSQESISLMQDTAGREVGIRNMANHIQDVFNMKIRDSVIEHFFAGELNRPYVQLLDEGFEEGM